MSGSCRHLDQINDITGRTSNGCEEYLQMGEIRGFTSGSF